MEWTITPQTGNDWYQLYRDELQGGPRIINQRGTSLPGTLLSSALMGLAVFFRRRLLFGLGAEPIVEIINGLVG